MTGRTARLGLFISLVFAGTLTSAAAPVRAQRICCQGNEWLKLNHKVREWYVIGYVLGYAHGHREGCERAFAGQPKSDDRDEAADRCKVEESVDSKGTDFLINAVTEFYTRYPDARDIYIYEVLDALGRNLTLEEIHKYPFMRHKVPT